MKASFIAHTNLNSIGHPSITDTVEVDSAPDDTILDLFLAMYNQFFGTKTGDDYALDSDTFFFLGGVLTEETAVLDEGNSIYRLTVWEACNKEVFNASL